MAHFAALKTVFEPVFGIDLSLPAATVPRADRDDPVQASPVAASDYTFTNQDAPVTFHVLANDTDADNDPLTIVTIQNPANGSVVKNANQTLTYVPDAGFSGTDVFFYSATDGSGASYANVFVTVHPAPATPVLPGTEFLSYNFDFGTEGMSYVDGAFRGASAGSYSGGSMSADALAVTLGGTDNAVVDDANIDGTTTLPCGCGGTSSVLVVGGASGDYGGNHGDPSPGSLGPEGELLDLMV